MIDLINKFQHSKLGLIVTIILAVLALWLLFGQMRGCVHDYSVNQIVNSQQTEAQTKVRQAENAAKTADNSAVKRASEDARRTEIIEPARRNARANSDKARVNSQKAKKEYENSKKPQFSTSDNLDDLRFRNCREWSKLYPGVALENCQ